MSELTIENLENGMKAIKENKELPRIIRGFIRNKRELNKFQNVKLISKYGVFMIFEDENISSKKILLEFSNGKYYLANL